MIDLTRMTTEGRNPNTMNLDEMTPLEIVTVMNREDSTIAIAVARVLNEVATVAEWASDSFRKGGRLIYMGAGTSGRLGLLDAVECPPTFGVSSDTVIGLIAGGQNAFVKAVEGAEDSEELCVKELSEINLCEKDTVVGVAASGRTPYVIGGLKYARELKCRTATIACNRNSEVSRYADVAIEIVVGPEVLTGSTRLRAGTAQKMVLNMISTAAMVGVGKAYQNLMVDVKQSNKKLQIRAENIVMDATGVAREEARELLDLAQGNAKQAIVMALLGCGAEEAQQKLTLAQGHVRGCCRQ